MTLGSQSTRSTWSLQNARLHFPTCLCCQQHGNEVNCDKIDQKSQLKPLWDWEHSKRQNQPTSPVSRNWIHWRHWLLTVFSISRESSAAHKTYPHWHTQNLNHQSSSLIRRNLQQQWLETVTTCGIAKVKPPSLETMKMMLLIGHGLPWSTGWRC